MALEKQSRLNTCFAQEQLRAIADALGDTEVGLTGSEIGHLLVTCHIADTDPPATKRHRLFNAFANDQNRRGHRRHIVQFVRVAMKPERFTQEPHRFEPMRELLNRALAFASFALDPSGDLQKTQERARTLSDADRRARELRADLSTRGVHPDVLRFCQAELLADSYFHAVLEAVKKLADKIRTLTGRMMTVRRS